MMMMTMMVMMMMMVVVVVVIVCLCHIIHNISFTEKLQPAETTRQTNKRRGGGTKNKQTNTCNKTERERERRGGGGGGVSYGVESYSMWPQTSDQLTDKLYLKLLTETSLAPPPPPHHPHPSPPTPRLPPKSISGFQNRLIMYTPYRPNTTTTVVKRSTL